MSAVRRLDTRIGRNPFPEPPWMLVAGIPDSPRLSP